MPIEMPMVEKIKNRINGQRAIKRRDMLMRKQNGLCYWCKEAMLPVKVKGDGNPKDLTATIDHIIPIADGGRNILGNTVAAHYKCNQERNSEWQRSSGSTDQEGLTQ